MPADYDSIYSPETGGTAAGDQALVVARRELQQQVVAWKRQIDAQQAAINQQKQEVETARAVVRADEAKNWLETTRVDAEKTGLKNQAAIIKRDKDLLAEREKQLREQEDDRRRNRSLSVAFIEDSFTVLSARSVLEHLTNKSLKIKNHAMANISACIGGFKESPPTFARFTPQDIAPDLLPKLHQLLSTSIKPLDDDVKFAENVASAPPVAKALALSGQCSRLADFLVETNEFASRLAVCSFRRMVGMETSVVKPAYEAMALVIPNIPDSGLGQPFHPAIEFVKDVAPKIVEDCFNNGLWLAVAPLISHRIPSIRQIVLRKVVLLAQLSDRNQHGLVEAHILGLLDPYYQSPSPPPDIVDFFVEILPLVTERLCRRPGGIQWLLTRLSDPNPRINAATITAFRMDRVKQDPTILQMFVKAELLRKLDEPPTQQSTFITQLICELFPVLAVPYARAKAAEAIVAFLDHSEAPIADACLKACIRIIDSTVEDRSHLFSVTSRLNFAKASTLKLYDHAMPAFCKDWVVSGDFKTIAQFIQHPQERIRLPAQKFWCDIVCNSPSTRSKIVHDGLLEVIFELCSSQYVDAVVVGAKCCSPMAIEITKAGVTATRQLVTLLSHPMPLLRQAALRAIQVASESNDATCKVLLEADTFKSLHLFFEAYPKDLLENAHKILTRLAPFLHTSSEACTGLLQLLESGSPLVEHAARSALTTISNSNLDGRQTLRTVVLTNLQLPTEALIEYSTKAIQDWIGPDLAQLNDFTTFFSLILHSDRRIQTSALISLKQKISNSNHQESLEKAEVISMIRTLTESDNPEALNFVMVALRVLALSLARNGHSSTIIDLLTHKEPKVREGASTALDAIANGSVQERKPLLDEDIIQRLIGHEEHLEQTPLHVLSSIIPKLAIDYLNAGKIELILTLVDHQQQQIRTAATKSVAIMAGGTTEQKALLRDALVPRLDQASPLLREVAASCLSRTLTHDLVVDGKFTQLFPILKNEDVHIRESIIKELRAHIQGSDEAARRRLVDDGILPAILEAQPLTKSDLLNFMSTCVLPLLGPAFTQNDGGSTLFPLLTHEESRIRTAAIQALKSAIDSRHGNMENMARACVVETLHPLALKDEAVRDLWCRILPKTAPHFANPAEIDILFKSLNDNRQNMREAASDALVIMAKTSEVTRGYIFPALVRNIENLSPEALPLVAQVISLSGFTFISSGKERELLNLISDEEPDIVVAAVDATTQLITKGSSFEHQKLLKADVFSVALELHDRRSQRQHSLKLLHAIVSHLSYAILTDHDDAPAREMFGLFDDPDPGLSSALYQTWSSDSRVYESHALPEFLPLLFDDDKLRNPSVTALLRQIVPHMVPQLVSRRRLDIIVKGLRVSDVNVIQVFLQETRAIIAESNENEKEWFVREPLFISVIGKHLKGRDATMRRDSSIIIRLLSNGSSTRSGRIMNEGIGRDLSWIAVNGEKGAQQSSLHALHSLFMAAPDHADRLVAETLPALCDIFEQEDQALDVYLQALRLLVDIVRQSSHSVVIKSGIEVDLVRWLSPQHNVTDMECREYVFEICQLIAQQSDDGRKALINAKVLPEISFLATSHKAIEVVSACKILKALAHSGTYRNDIISAGLKDTMENITSPFRKSTLQLKEDKQLAQASAKEVLMTLKLSKRNSRVGSLAQTDTAPRRLQHAHSNTDLSTRRSVSEYEVPEVEPRPRQNMLRRSATEPDASPEFSTPIVDGLSNIHTIRHIRSLSEGNRPAFSRGEATRLSAVYEDQADIIEEEGLRSSTATRTRRSPNTRLMPVEDHFPTFALGEENYVTSPLGNYQTMPPSPRTTTAVSRTVRRQILDHDDPRDFMPTTAEEENINIRETASIMSRTAPPSYRPMSSVIGSVRQRAPDHDLPDSIVAEEANINFREAVASTSRTVPSSYRDRSSSRK